MVRRCALAALAVAAVAVVAPPLWAQQVRTVAGRVHSAADSAPLAGVRVRILGTRVRAESGRDGDFVLRNVPNRVVRLVFGRIGIHPDTVQLGASQHTITVYLRVRAVAVSPFVTVSDRPARERFENLAQTSTVSLDPLEIASAPTLAEPDVARTVQLLPGTVARNDFTVGLNVRGGETDQNLIRLDGITVFNPFHVGGLFSTFDAAAVDRVDFVTGGFPAGFGGRLSSVLDVQLRSGNPSDMDAHGSVSLLAAKLLVDGPIGETGVTYLVGVRRTYADAFADAFSDDAFSYYFGDVLAKVTAALGTGGVLSVFGYWGRDALVLPWVDPEPGRDGIDVEFSWGNRLAGVTLRQPLGSVAWEQHFSVSAFSTRLGLVPDVLRADNAARLLTARSTVAFPLGGGHDVRIGVGVEAYSMDYDFRDEALETQLLDLAYRPTIWSAFLDDQWNPVDWLLVRPGVRFESTPSADFSAVSPRVGFKVFLSRDIALTGSAGRYYQAVHSIRDQELPITLFDYWIGADDLTPVARSDHVVLGLERWFGSDVSLSVEGYAKSFDDLALRNFRDDFKVRGDEFIATSGFSRGVDVLLRRYRGTIRGWLAYGYAKTLRRAGGVEFPPAHDRRHTLNAVVQMPGPLGSDMTVRWGYGSPMPYTGVVGQWLHREYNAERHEFDNHEDEVLSTTINGERFPHYSRLDVGFRWEFEKWGATWRPFFQVVNLYNRRNVFVYTFDYGTRPPTRSGYSQLPFFPTFGVEFAW